MAEKQFVTYKSDITSFELGEAMLGVLSPGRYRGYSDISSGGTPAAGVIPVHLNHTTSGIQKGTHANPPILSDKTGIIISPQGTIIHNTDVDIDVSIDEGATSTRIDLIYVEHEFYDVEGDNPSIVGVQKGTPGGGVPTLSKPAEQVAIIQVTIEVTDVTFASLSFEVLSPTELGDYNIETEVNDIINNIIGDRQYSINNYITDSETITQSLNDLDIALKTEETARITVGNRAIDAAVWGSPTDITNANVTTSAHGLTPKAPGIIGAVQKYLGGAGVWRTLKDDVSKVQPLLTPGSNDFNLGTAVSTNSSGEVDLSGKLPADFAGGLVILEAYLAYNSTSNTQRVAVTFWGSSIYAGNGISIEAGNTTYQKIERDRQQILIPVDAAKKIYWVSGTYRTHIIACYLTYFGYIEGKID